MTVKGVSTKTRGDYVVVDLTDGRVVALDLVTVHRALGELPREVVAAAPDPHVFIDRSG